MMQGPNGVPVLGQQKPTHGTVAVTALIRHLDENGLYRLGPNGAPLREHYLDVEDLLEAIRQTVREELAAAVVRGRDQAGE